MKRRALAAFAVVFLVVAAVLAIGPGKKVAPPLHQMARAERQILTLEAESAEQLVVPMRVREHPTAFGGKCLVVKLGEGKPPEKPEGSAIFRLTVVHAGTYRLWIRAWWIDGCSNSVATSFDGRTPDLVGNDGTYGRWHWVKGLLADLAAGAHELKLLHREDGIELDQLVLSNDEQFEPADVVEAAPESMDVARNSENLKPAYEHPPSSRPLTVWNPEAIDLSAPEAPKIPEHPVAPAQPIKKFVVGIAGCYRDGWEMHLVSLGIPYVRLREEEVGEIEKLKDIDLLIVGDPRPSGGGSAFYKTLYAFLKSGRTAIVEDPPEDYPGEGDDPDNLLMRHGAPRDSAQVTLQADDSAFFKDVPRSRTYHPDVRCHWLPTTTLVPDTKIYGGVSYGRSQKVRSGALLVRKYGGGKLYFLGFPASFAAMWRERAIDPYVVNILRDAIAGRTPFRLEGFSFAPAQPEHVSLSDDFMRTKGELGAWKVLAGSFACTGQIDQGEDGFAFKGLGSARAEVGAAGWKDYRPMVSLKMQSGRAGLWHATADGGRLTLLYDEAGSKVTLLECDAHGAEKTLGEAGVPEFGGWRRLALFQRGGKTYGFVDGAQVLAIPGGPAAQGTCGVEVRDGCAFFDDFKAVDVTALEPGRDVVSGEESSQRCLERYRQRCFERLSVYSPQWFLEPDPSDAGLWRFALPLFLGGTLYADGKPQAHVPANSGFPHLRFLENKPPVSDLAINAPGLRDFHFAGRVTDWYASSGLWDQGNRWSCSPEYLWYSGASRQMAALWYKHAVEGKAAMEVLMAPRADEYFGQEQGRDLNLCIFGNGRDLTKGYLFVVGAAGQGCRILKDGKELASTLDAGLPSGHALHHAWFSVTAVVADGKLQLWFDRRLACEATDPAPLTQGKLGIWTQQNKISLGRATLSLEK